MTTFTAARTGLAITLVLRFAGARLRAVRFAGRLLPRRAARPDRDVLVVLVARIAFALIGLLCYGRPINKNCYFLRSTMFLSVRLLFLVFFPNVGKAHGVCGWLPFTRPSPPPCG